MTNRRTFLKKSLAGGIAIGMPFSGVMSGAVANKIVAAPGLKDYAGDILIGARCDIGLKDITMPILEKEFNAIQPTYYPGQWKSLHEYGDLTRFNDWVNWGVKNNKKVIMHMLAGGEGSHYYADWTKNGKWDVDVFDKHFEEYIKHVITSNDNGKKVHAWNVVNECFNYNLSGKYWDGDQESFLHFMGFEEDMSGLSGDDKINDAHPVYIRKAFEYAGKYAEGRLELRETHFEFAPDSNKTKAMFQLIKHLRAKGARVDALGFQCHLVADRTYDENDLVRTVEKFKQLGGLEMYVTELDIACTGDDLELQRRKYKELITACRKAGFHQVHTWGIADDQEWWLKGKHPLLFDENFKKKPAYYGVLEALQDHK